ncbi:MAG: DUF1385 domain-containing protein [Oscillospiraceae bacterium]|nr:DUF1385 domain-containing protein [Oscillospiraceae bacterium]
MSKQQPQEKFKTTIGGQALIEGIMMRGPQKDAIVVRQGNELNIDVRARKIPPKKSWMNLPIIRGIRGFFDSQVTGVKALMHSADLSPEETQEEPSKLDVWLEKKLGNEKFQQLIVGIAVFMGLAMSIGLFMLLPMLIGNIFTRWIGSLFVIHLIEGLIRIVIFVAYIVLVSRMKEMKRVFAYHGAEHKTIRCYEAGLPLTVENVRAQTRLHPRCGTSFLLVVMILSILVFTVASSALLAAMPALKELSAASPVLYKLVMVAFKLLLLPLIVGIAYEINRFVGRHDNFFTRIITAPGMWFQNFTTNEPDDSMIEVGIAAVQAVLPEKEGEDLW